MDENTDPMLMMLASWLFDAKNLAISGSFKLVKQTEKALLIEDCNASTTWIPKSQIRSD